VTITKKPAATLAVRGQSSSFGGAPCENLASVSARNVNYQLTGALILQRLPGYNVSVAVWVGYIALFGSAVETGVVMVVYLHEALDHRLNAGVPLRHEDIEAAVIEGLSTS
jgi:Cu/Ag efflux pump CusA